MHEDGFSVENMKSKSAAAANLCSWVISIYTYNRIYVKVCRKWRMSEVRDGGRAVAASHRRNILSYSK